MYAACVPYTPNTFHDSLVPLKTDRFEVAYLIVDPHYTGKDELKPILSKGWVGWKMLGNDNWEPSIGYTSMVFWWNLPVTTRFDPGEFLYAPECSGHLRGMGSMT